MRNLALIKDSKFQNLGGYGSEFAARSIMWTPDVAGRLGDTVPGARRKAVTNVAYQDDDL
jgi:hypothetical protein